MGQLGVLACVALALVLLVSGCAKLADRVGTRQAVAGFGVPARFQAVVATGLAPAELAIALLLVIPATARLGLLLASVLLICFTLAVVWAISRGRRPECHCFGRIGGADISSRTVARNVALVVLAVVGSIGLAVGERPSGQALAVAGVTGLAVGLLVLVAEGVAGRAARRARERAADEAFSHVERVRAPDAPVATLSGGRTSVPELLARGLPLFLVTLSPGCGPCGRLRPDVARWADVLVSRLTVAVVATGTRDGNLTAYKEAPDLVVLLDEEGRLREGLGIGAAPSAVVVGPDGYVSTGIASGEPLVRRLLVSLLTGTEVGDDPDPDQSDGTSVDALDLSSTVAPRDSVELHELGDATVLLDTKTGATVLVDHLGALVWSVLDGSSSLAEIVADLADVFDAPVDQVGADVLALVRQLGAAGLLAGVAPGAPTEQQRDDSDSVGLNPALTADHAGA